MMGFGGPMGSGVAGANLSSSSTSNLSALAPPFTVDRLNPRPSSNPLMNYPEAAYAVEPYSYTWQYATPSAPGPESAAISSVPFYDNYQISASESISPSSAQASASTYAYGGEPKPYYAPYVPPVVGGGSPEVEDSVPRYSVMPSSGMSVSSQVDYTPGLFDLEYGFQRMDSLGFDGRKRANRVELGGSFFSDKATVGSMSFKNQVNKGERGFQYWNKSKEDSGVSCKKLNLDSDPEVHYGSPSVGYMEEKSSLEQNLGYLPYESNNTHILASSLTYPEPRSLVSGEMHKNFSIYQSSNSPYEKCVKPVDLPYVGPVSTIRSSPTVVIRPPPPTNANLGQVVRTGVFDHPTPKLKDSVPKPSSEIKEDSYEPNLFNFYKQGNDKIDNMPASLKELSNPLHGKAKFVSQLPDMNVSANISVACDGGGGVNSKGGSSDLLENHHTAEDSPCWKGAPSSRFSSFDVEFGSTSYLKENLSEYYGFGPVELPNLHSIANSTAHFSDKAGEVNKKDNECAKNGVVFTLERTLDAICPSKESGLSNNLNSGFDMHISGNNHFIGEESAGAALNDVSEGGVVAVNVAEKVLDSPSSQEDTMEHSKQPDPKLNLPTMIKAIHNLSELLLFHLSDDACSLEKENTETLKHIISNLDSCITKKVTQETDKLEPSNPVEDTSDKLGESCNMGTGIPCETHEAANSGVQPNYQHNIHEGLRNYSFSGEEDVKAADFLHMRDDLDITTDDDMTKAIQNVLEENFHFHEEMHPQALLFKNLWLEAEARLCSISYKARFDRMKSQMEKALLRAPQENDDISEVISKVSKSSDRNTAPDKSPTAHSGTTPDSKYMHNISISGTRAHGDIEASVMARFNILKFRDENPGNTVNVEKEQQLEMADGEHASSIMDRFHTLKSQEEKLKAVDTEEEKHPERVKGGHTGPVMARFNILKSREEKSEAVDFEEGKRPEMVEGEHAVPVMARFNILKSREEKSKSIDTEGECQPGKVDVAGEKYAGPCMSEQSGDQILNVALKHHFLHQADGLGGGRFGSYAHGGSGYESLKERYPSVMNNDPMVNNSRIINQDCSIWRDSSPSSDWEHVLKDGFVWKHF